MELKWKISGNAMEVKWPETATVKMVPVLLMIFLTVSTTCTVDGQERASLSPVDEMTVAQGSNVSFICSAIANYAYWTVNTTRVHDGSHHQSYIFSQSVDECNYQSIGLVILTSELDESNLFVTCKYTYRDDCSGDGERHASTRTAHLTIVDESCLAPASSGAGVLITNITTFHNANGEVLAKIDIMFLFPPECAHQLLNYTLVIEDDSGDIVASPKGPIDYQGDMVVEEIVFGLNEDQLYWVQAMVATDLPEGRISSERIMIDTVSHNNIMKMSCKNNNNSINDASNSSSSHARSNCVMILTSVLGGAGVIILVIINIVIIILVFIFMTKKYKNRSTNRIGRISSHLMVTNPIYDGPMYDGSPMYESIPLSKKRSCPTNEDATTAATPVDSGSPRYTRPHPTSEEQSNAMATAKLYENIILPPSSTPPTSKTLRTSRERNKLQLTLSLEGVDSSAAEKRCGETTLSCGETTLDVPCDETKCTLSCDDNYAVMSPLARKR